MLIVISKEGFEEAITEAYREIINDAAGEDLPERVKTLRQQIETLEIEKGRKQEDFDRKEREVEHKVGLERKRQEQELTLAKRESTVSVREENLKADRDRFESQMKFQEERFTKEVGYLKEMLGDIVQRLPSAEFTADLTPARRKRA